MDRIAARRTHRHHLRCHLPLVLYRQAPARTRPRHPGKAAQAALHRRLASLPAQSRDAGRRRRSRQIPRRQIRQRRALAADGRAHHRDGRGCRHRVPSRQAHAHAQHRERPSPDPLRRPEGRAGRRRRGAVRGLFLQRRRHRRRQGAGRASAIAAASITKRCSRCWRATRASARCWRATRWRATAGIKGVPSFALQGHVLFSGAVPAEEMADAFHRAWELLKTKAA